MNKKISDKQAWENFLSNKETLPDKDINLEKKKANEQLSFDLHGYSLDDANKKVSTLIKNSYQRGIRKLVIVTGKGLHSQNEKNPYVSKNLGILKYSVPEFIKSSELNKFIISINDAEKRDGGEGAIIIKLKNL